MVDGDTIEVIYATPDEQYVVTLPLTRGLTAEQAVGRSGLLERCPEIAARELVLGSFGRRLERTHVLRSGDRVEICRPLVADPRQMRRALVAHGGVMGKGPEY